MLTAMIAMRGSDAASVEPALKPNHPNARISVPLTAIGRLWPGSAPIARCSVGALVERAQATLGDPLDEVGGNALVGERVDDRAEPGELVRVDLVPARAEGLHDLAGVDEHRHLVGVDDRAREAADGDVRPFEDDLTFAVVRYGDEFPPEQCHAQNHTGSLDCGIRRCQGSFPAIFRAWK